MLLVLGLLVVLMAFVPGTADASAEHPAGAPPTVRQDLDQMVADGEPGVAAQLDDVAGGWAASAGAADLASGAPMPASSVFRAASDTKSVVAAVVLQLVDEGRLRLTDTLADVLPGSVPNASAITIEELLRHTSGLFDYANDAEFSDPATYRWRSYTPAELVNVAVEHAPVSGPGEGFHYANTNYILLGMVIEKVTGHSLGDELAQRVFLPLGMRHTYLPTSFPLVLGPHATGYYRPGDGSEGPAPITDLDPSFAWAAYGLVSDADDLHRFYRALLGGRLLSPQTLRLMLEPISTGNTAFPEYGLGLEGLPLSCGGTVWGHTGSIPGYENFTFSSADGRRQITVLMNIYRVDPAVGAALVVALRIVDGSFCPATS